MKTLLISCLLVVSVHLDAVDLIATSAHSRDQRLADVIDRANRCFAFVGSASGVVINRDGEILTNYHVVYDEEHDRVRRDWMVRVGDQIRSATLLGSDPISDLALLRLENANDIPHVPLGRMRSLSIGDPVIAIGNPFGTSQATGDPSATTGIVSAMHRYVKAGQDESFPNLLYPDAIQTDAAINPGNSGGPLLNAAGELIGINGQIRTRYGARANTGIGLAISIAHIRRMLPGLRQAEGGYVFPGCLRGVTIAANGQGDVTIADVRDGSAAAALGLQAGDIVEHIDKQPLGHPSRWRGILGSYPAGAEVRIGLRRDDERISLLATLETYHPGLLGVRLKKAETRYDYFDLKVVRPMRAIQAEDEEAMSFLKGDRLIGIAGRQLRHQLDIRRILREAELLAGDQVVVDVLRAGERIRVPVTLRERYPAPGPSAR